MKKKIRDALFLRESQGSTAFENGIAIPHARLKGIKNITLHIFISKKGIPFKSIDKKKTRLFFVIIGPEDKPNLYLQLLALTARVLKNKKAREEFLAAESPLALKEIYIKNMPAGLIKKEMEKNKPQNEKLLMIVLYEKRYFEDIINLFIEKGIRGASVLESNGIHNMLSQAPLFSDFISFL